MAGVRIEAGTWGRGALLGLSAWLALGTTITRPAPAPTTLALLPSAYVLAAAIALAIGLLHAARPRQVPWTLIVLSSLCSGAAWLPIGPVAAVHAWTGVASLPLLVLVVALAMGPLAARLSVWSESRTAPWMAAAIAVVWMIGISAALKDRSITGDEPHYLLIAASVLADGDFDLKNNYDERDLQAYYAGPLEPRHVSLGVLGQEFSFHGPGAGVLALPGFALGGPFAARLSLALLLAAATGLLWSTIRRVTQSIAAAWAGWASFVLCAPASLNGAMIYPDGPGAVVTIFALWVLVRSEDEMPPAQATLTMAGLALAALPWLHLRLGLVSACFGIGLAIAAWKRADAWARLVCLFAAPIASASMLVFASWTMFRELDPTAVFRQHAAGSLAVAPTGILGLLFDHEYGLLPYAPCFALAPLGLLLARRRYPYAVASGAAAAGGTLLVAASWVWWGGQSAPARFLVPVLPILALGAGAAAGCGPIVQALIAIALAFSATLTVVTATADGGAYTVNVPDGIGSIFNWLSPSVDLGLALPSLFRSGTSPAHEAAIALVWVAAFAITALALRTMKRTGVAAAAVTAVAACTAASAAVWKWRDVSPWTLDRAQLTLLYAGAHASLPIAAEAPWPRAVSRSALWSHVSIATPRADDELLRVPLLPAGRYRVDVEPGSSANLALELGQNAWPLATWQADRSEPLTFTIAFPVWAARVTAGDDASLSPKVTLHPIDVAVEDATRSDLAWRLGSYGGLVVYSLDRASAPEAGGVRLLSDRDARLAITDRDGRPRAGVLHLEADAAPVTVTVEDDHGWRAEAELTSGERADIRTPHPDGPSPARLTFRVRAGSDSPDRERIGVWLTVGQPD